MESFTVKSAIITGYLLNGKVYLLTKKEVETLFNYLLLKKENANSIPLKYILGILELDKFIIPLTEFYDYIEKKGENFLTDKSMVDLVITDSQNYLINVNKYLAPIVPGFYLLFSNEPTFDYSLRYVNNRLTIILSPNTKDCIVNKLVDRIQTN